MSASTDSSPQQHKLEIHNWVKRYSDYLFNYATYRVSNEDEARDLVQDTFLSALKAKDSFRGESSEKTWLVTILKRKIIDYYRKRSVQGIQQSIDGGRNASHYGDYFNEDGDMENHWSKEGRPVQWVTGTSSKLESGEFYSILNKCLNMLPEKWASVFRMKNMEDEDSEIICKELNVSSSNYWIIMHRAKLQLRKCLEINWMGIGNK